MPSFPVKPCTIRRLFLLTNTLIRVIFVSKNREISFAECPCRCNSPTFVAQTGQARRFRQRSRKVRATQSAMLPNGKAVGKPVDRKCHRERYRLRGNLQVRVKTGGKSSRSDPVTGCSGKPHGLKGQINQGRRCVHRQEGCSLNLEGRSFEPSGNRWPR